MQPVTKLTGNEFAKGDTDLMTQVLNYFDSLGNSVYSEQFGDVALTKSSWRSERRHGMTALKANCRCFNRFDFNIQYQAN